MKSELLNEIIDCLPKERTLYHYHRDKYAFYLLNRFLKSRQNTSVGELKRSQFKALLEKPSVREILSRNGSGYLTYGDFCWWSDQFQSFVLTLGHWGYRRGYSWTQMSRPGSNLVLQLNLVRRDDSAFEKTFGRRANDYLDYGHPISQKRPTTLAWARLDFDFDTGEVLVEEIQSDLIREISRLYKLAQNAASKKMQEFQWREIHFKTNNTLSFCSNFIRDYKNNWAEIMLSAALWFIHQELGFDKVYYHSFETSKAMKNLGRYYPPRSLYTELPKRFCFQKTGEAPNFIQQDKKAQRRLKTIKQPEWYFMAI